MQQLILDLGRPPEPSFDNFVPGANGAAVASLRAIAAGQGERAVHLWGEAGAGRSHLLRALGAVPGARYVACGDEPVPAVEPGNNTPTTVTAATTTTIWCIDNVERCTPDEQIALFNLINATRALPRGAVVTSGDAPPLAIALDPAREDLRTRLGWGPVFCLVPLTDAQKCAALEAHAAARGLALTPEIGRYLLSHFARDLPSLLRLVERLDTFALQQHRQVTLPLIRDFERAVLAAEGQAAAAPAAAGAAQSSPSTPAAFHA